MNAMGTREGMRVSFIVKRFAILLALACAACGGRSELGGAPNLQVVTGEEMPAPERTDIAAADRPYLIGPFDRLIIDVFGIEELNQREIQTDASGRLSFPLAGVVEAAGKTPAEVERELEDRLRIAHVRNPQVTVNLKETVSQVVTVDGQVRRPGLYPVVGRMTLMRAVARAEGVAEFAKLDDVVVFRTVQGQRLAALYNLKAIRRGMYGDPEIYANDVVIVGDSPSRRIFRDFLQIAPLLSSPLVVALQ